MNHKTAINMMDRAFVGELAPRKMATLRAHLSTCETCRERYDRLTRAGQAAAAVARGEGAISDELDVARLKQEFFDQPEPGTAAPAEEGWLPRWLWAAVPAAAVLVVAVGLVVLGPGEDDELQVRGNRPPVTREQQVAFRAFTLSDDGAVRDLRTERRAVLAPDDPIKFAYTNLDPAVKHLAICYAAEHHQVGCLVKTDCKSVAIAEQPHPREWSSVEQVPVASLVEWESGEL